MKGLEKIKQEIEERGYSHVDMRDIRREVNYKRREWVHKFDEYIGMMFYEEPRTSAEIIIETCARLADHRQEYLDKKFPEGVEIPEDET